MTTKFPFFKGQTNSIDSSTRMFVTFAQFVRKASINSKESYAKAFEVSHFMDHYLSSMIDYRIELDAEYQAVASLQKRLQQRMEFYLRQAHHRAPKNLKVK